MESPMSKLRIFSYLPNPRIWKATVAARLCGVEVEVRGSSPQELQSWLWDFDARPLASDEPATSADVCVGKVGFQGASLHKTQAFLEAHPFGTVPAAFSPDGKIGIFESNSRASIRSCMRRSTTSSRGPWAISRDCVSTRRSRPTSTRTWRSSEHRRKRPWRIRERVSHHGRPGTSNGWTFRPSKGGDVIFCDDGFDQDTR